MEWHQFLVRLALARGALTGAERQPRQRLAGSHAGRSPSALAMTARYRVLVLTPPAEASRLSALAQAQLRNTDVTVVDSAIEPAGRFARLVLVVACALPGRAALSRLVGQLGLEQSVRSVQWESVPQALPETARC